jgi:predicted DNA-binding protein
MLRPSYRMMMGTDICQLLGRMFYRSLDLQTLRCKTFFMDVQLTPEQEARLAQIASLEGVEPVRLVQNAVSQLIEEFERSARICPECGHRFKGLGWEGIDAHWRAKHENVMTFESAWELLRAGNYDSEHLENLEDLKIAEERLAEFQEGRSTTHSLDEVERDLGLAS